MARPRKSENVREKLLQEGMTLLAENGYHGTGLKQILDLVQVPKGSFYNYFDSKEAYVAEIVDHYIETLLQLLDDYLAHTEDSPLEIIHSVYDLHIGLMEAQGCQQGCLIGNLAAETGARFPQIQQALLRAVEEWKQRFVPLVTAAQQQNQLRRDLPPQQLCDLFWSFWEGGVMRMKMEGNADELRAHVKLMLDQILAPQPIKAAALN